MGSDGQNELFLTYHLLVLKARHLSQWLSYGCLDVSALAGSGWDYGPPGLGIRLRNTCTTCTKCSRSFISSRILIG